LSADTHDLDVVIIGAGFSGLGMAIALQAQGGRSFVVLEKGAGVGGTWRENTYPGCACDVPSHLYSYSFEPNPHWSRMFATQPEILAYLESCADRHGVRDRIRLNTAVTGLTWQPDAARWRVETADGRALTARVVVAGAGGLHVPAFPEAPGVDTFSGPAFHTAQWRSDVDLTGKRVAVVGTGASAIQVVPEIAKVAGRLTVFQRSPPWIMPKADRTMQSWEKRLFSALPGTQEALRRWIYLMLEVRALNFVKARPRGGIAERMARRHIAAQIADPALRAKVTPDYVVGCKRVLLSNDYYPALTQPNVSLVTEAVREVTPGGLVTADGVAHAADVIVWATGFKPFEVFSGIAVTGRDGRRLDAEWSDHGPQTLLGVSAAGFPNLFFLMGPNTGLGHNSMIFMIESQIAHVMDALAALDSTGAAAIEPRGDAQAAFADEIAERLRQSVWGSGCRSWYVGADGRNFTTWPGFTFEYRRRTKRISAEDYVTAPT
jgi:cation diffusion facilitator CzcD-associated flavoprotein CzcO